MADLATNTMKLELAVGVTGLATSVAELERLNSDIGRISNKTKKAQEALELERLSIEAKYSPEAARELALIKTNQLQERLNLSTETYAKMLQEIEDKYTAATRPDVFSTFSLSLRDDMEQRFAEEQRVNNARIADSERVAKEQKKIQEDLNAKKKAQEALELERLQIEGKYNPDIQRDYEIEKAIKLTDRFNLSLETQNKILDEIQAKYREATIGEVIPTKDLFSGYHERVALEKKADAERVASIAKAQKEVERIQNEEMNHTQKYAIELQRIRDLEKQGLPQDQADILRKRNLDVYNDAVALEAKKAKAKQDAIDKDVAADKAAIDKKNKAFMDAFHAQQSLSRKNVRAFSQAEDAADAAQRAAMLKSTVAVEKEFNAERQRAVALMNNYSSATERAASDVAYFNAALAAGTITAEEHSRAIDGVDRRMRSMAGGAGNMGYVVGNVMTGLEDFTTVLSITGFGMDGFAAATRSASNNVGQAVRGMGTASAAMLAPMVSIGMVLVGFAIPAIYRWVTGAEDAAEATKKWSDELARLITLHNSLTFDLEKLKLDRFKASIEVEDISSVDDIDKKITDTLFKMNELDIEIRKKSDNVAKSAEAMWGALIPENSLEEFNKISNFLGDKLGGNVATELENRLREIKADFLENSIKQGGEKAKIELERQMRALVETMNRYKDSLSIGDQLDLMDVTPSGGLNSDWFNAITGTSNLINDAAVIDRIQAAKEEIATLTQKDNDEARKLTAELESEVMLLEQMLEKRQELLKIAKIWEEGERLGAEVANKAELANDLEILRIQNEKNKLLGAENEAERKLLDLALRRREIMESGLAAPDVLEGMFNDELEAIAADIEDKLSKIQQIKPQVAMQNQAQAYTDANRQMLEASKDKKDEEKEMVQLLNAIEKHLAGNDLINMAVI